VRPGEYRTSVWILQGDDVVVLEAFDFDFFVNVLLTVISFLPFNQNFFCM
jgi:hypothetical protein